jgi:hypothetical protein
MKLWMKILLIVVIVLAGVVVAGWLTIDSIAKAAIEKAGTEALGVETRVDSVSLHLFRGQAIVKGIVIANPEGCNKEHHLMKTGSLEAVVEIGSLFTDTVIIDKFQIEGLDIYVDQPSLGKLNLTMLLDNMKAHAAPATAESGKKFKVGSILLTNSVAHLQVLPIGGQATIFDVKVPEIKMDNVTSDNASGVAMPELMRRVIPAIFMAVVDKAKGLVPAGGPDLNKLGGDIASTTQALGAGAANMVKQAGGEAGKLLENVGGGAKDIGSAIEKKVGNPLEDFLKKKPGTTAKP